MVDNILKCPVCSKTLALDGRTYKCGSNHCFDCSKDGYVNLLLSGKPGDKKGDNKDMARSRRDFLNQGFYHSLAEAVGECVELYSPDGGNILDICCGEGYYTNFLSRKYNRRFYGFDISKNMIRLAGKRRCGATFFVANISSIPIQSGTVDMAFHLFAPFHAEEFARVLADDGVLVTAVPGKNHLFGLKQSLYDEPYYNDEQEPDAKGLALVQKIRVRDTITLKGKQNINALFQMTPYYYHTPAQGMRRLEAVENLTTDIEFILLVYKKALCAHFA